ncbi:MAG TPA: tetratricopeptide repeat protein [Nitrospirota bacterium]|nr:tetratricopeptide repeat protein [Nitrospirota bacterium]
MDKETSEIAKLTERILKDPKSKLFVPLAEEYKKAGDLEMSIHVLMEGLKNNPEYVTARSFLGRLLFEKGDLAGAQKEFEEVARTIPDNLMAHRKLGDLYVLQDRPADALKHYKMALSLNPGDEELAALASDVEAGRDVKERLLKPKQPTTDKPAKSAPVKAQVEPRPAPKAPEPPRAPAMSAVKPEEPEEVLVVEPLDVELQGHGDLATGIAGQKMEEIPPEAAEQGEKKVSAGEFDFLAEQGQGTGPAPMQEEPAEITFDTAEPGQGIPTSRAATAEPAQVETEPALKVPEAASQKGDDFTTDTLAELYIAQGFFEKAIDIYQRMLTDNPDSQKLKDKLAHVRAMASEAERTGELKIDGTPVTTASEEVIVLGGPGKPAETGSGLTVETVPDVTPPKPLETGFEPVEYVPPQAAEKHEPLEKKAPPMMKSPMAGRKETIDRLENWLKNIKKEK